jgi:hypothetical protein
VIRRLFWLLVGMAAGMGATVWLLRALRIRVLETTPGGVVVQVGGSLRRLGADLRDAVDEGRTAMHEREAELRHRLDGPATPTPPQLLPADPLPQVLPRRQAAAEARHRPRARARRLSS